MEFKSAHDFAVKKASEEFGSDVLQKINNKYASSATGRLNYAMRTIKALADFFETQNLVSEKENKEIVKELNSYVKNTVDGDGSEIKGIITNLKQYFWNQEFKRDPEKKKAIALYLKHYLEYLKNNVKHITVEQFLEIYDDIDVEAKYFDKEYVFGELITVINDELNKPSC